MKNSVMVLADFLPTYYPSSSSRRFILKSISEAGLYVTQIINLTSEKFRTMEEEPAENIGSLCLLINECQKIHNHNC